VGDWAIAQLWLFWVAPIVGGVLGAVTYRFIASEKVEDNYQVANDNA
jgi:aquaporin Z